MATVSNSRLDTFTKCAQLYNLKYVRKIKQPVGDIRPITEPLIKGSFTHICIEKYLKEGLDKEESIEQAIVEWLTETIGLPVSAASEDFNNGQAIDIESITQYAKQFGKLLQRFLPCYNKEDKIRTQSGGIIKDPVNYSFRYKVKAVTEPYNSLNLGALKSSVDIQAVRCNHYFRHMSLADVAAEAASWFYAFELPADVNQVLSVEMKLDHKKVYLKKGVYWNGAIDTEYESNDGAVIINDHKSEKELRRPEDIQHDLQLNNYAFIRTEQTGHIPDYLAISHLRSGGFTAVETDPTIVEAVQDYLLSIQNEIDSNIERHGTEGEWLKKWPGKYGSPCLRRNWQTNYLEEVCPYLQHCHPLYYESIKDEADEYFGACVEEKTEVLDIGEYDW